jgi:hypothetical protein
MGTTAGVSTEEAAAFPLRLSLAPLRLAEAKDNVPCLKPPELVERWTLVDLCGAMNVVVVIESVTVDVGLYQNPDRPFATGYLI